VIGEGHETTETVTIEHVLDGNIVYFVRLEGSSGWINSARRCSACSAKHPALRALIREAPDGLYYEEDSAPEIPLRIVPRIAEDDYRREYQTELTTDLPMTSPSCARSGCRQNWKAICCLRPRIESGRHEHAHNRQRSIAVAPPRRGTDPYAPITIQDIIGDYQPPQR